MRNGDRGRAGGRDRAEDGGRAEDGDGVPSGDRVRAGGRTERGGLLARLPRFLARLPRFRTLRARITFGLVVLLAVSCAAVGVAAVVELNGFLTQRLDEQLAQVGTRFPESLEHHGKLPDDHDGDEEADTRRMATGTFGACLRSGAVTDKGLIRSGDLSVDLDITLTARDAERLARIPDDGRPHTVELSALGHYRVVATPGRDGDVLMAGLPLKPVEAAVHRLELVAGIVFGLALVTAGVSGALWVRWSLRPLGRVTATATRVSELPLASGVVALPPRAPVGPPPRPGGRGRLRAVVARPARQPRLWPAGPGRRLGLARRQRG